MYAVILAGGSGTRLWPLSHEQLPKQFIDLTGRGYSLFQDTITRIRSIVPENRIIVVTHEGQEDSIKHQTGQMGLKGITILKEPRACNTAPAIGLAAWYITSVAAKNKNPTMVVLPSDHMVTPNKDFIKLINRGKRAASVHGIVTFGIKPDCPETGYGYILCGHQLEDNVFRVDRFVEKPDLSRAKEYLKDKRYIWNSGIFMFKTRELMRQYRRYLPVLAAGLDRIHYENLDNLKQVYNSFDSISIDNGLLEKTPDTTVIPADITWSDIGSWDAVYKILPKDADGNLHKGRILSIDSKNTLAFSNKPLVGLIGVENISVIATESAFLICAKERSQEVKKLMEGLEKDSHPKPIACQAVHRPWGSYTVLTDEDTYKVKKITVNPGCRLSLQSHQYRSEHWFVAKGQALITVNDREKLLKEGDYSFIPAKAKHRLENKIREPLEIIEIQKGSYFGEDDIIRYEDDYGRDTIDTP